MKDYDLEPAKKVLRAFLQEIEEVRALLKSIVPQMPASSFVLQDRVAKADASEFDPTSDDFWEKEHAYMWLYGDAWNLRSFMHIPKPNSLPDYYKQPASPIYQEWLQEEKELFCRNCKIIPPPAEETSLADYLQTLALAASEGNEHRSIWIKSLRSLLQFLREDTERCQRGFLEKLFPSKDSCKGMELRKESLPMRDGEEIKAVERRLIVRRIEETVYPIDILASSEILMNLAKTVLEGRPNSQRSAAEALGFAWLCHAVGCYRLVTREELVFSTQTDHFKSVNMRKPQPEPTHFIGVDSLFGMMDVPVSKMIYEFLLALPRDSASKNVFTMDLDGLSRTFRKKGVQEAGRAEDLGRITFLTFMSQPHEAIGHRSSHETVAHRAT